VVIRPNPTHWALVPIWNPNCRMRIIALSTLKAFWAEDPRYIDAKDPTLAWYRHTLKADWAASTEVKQDFGKVTYSTQKKLSICIKISSD